MQALQVQKRRVEDEKKRADELQRESKVAGETCQEIEKKKEKLQHDLQVKENQCLALETKLVQSKDLEARNRKVIIQKNHTRNCKFWI